MSFNSCQNGTNLKRLLQHFNHASHFFFSCTKCRSPVLFCFLLGLMGDVKSVCAGSPLPFLSLQLSESLPLATPSLLPERDRASGDPFKTHSVILRTHMIRATRELTYLICSGHAGFIGHVVCPAQLFNGFCRHGLGEAKTAPCVSGGADLCYHRLLQHG